ncbi:MAG TPA: hypothetical protein VK177_13130 [Flavobacteriales bacterium]|nr:hypothetical protein [Flavobacteriales bacterium]
MTNETIHCDKHGPGRPAFVCQHLSTQTKTGFHEEFESVFGMDLPGEDEDFGAWCDVCEVERAKEGEWNEHNEDFAGIRVVCESCFFEIKTVNRS